MSSIQNPQFNIVEVDQSVLDERGLKVIKAVDAWVKGYQLASRMALKSVPISSADRKNIADCLGVADSALIARNGVLLLGVN